MGWRIVEAVAPIRNGDRIPPEGVKITSRGSQKAPRWIYVAVGSLLARDLGWSGERVSVRLMVGNQAEAGKIAFSADTAGGFSARRSKHGSYSFVLNAPTCRGRFNTGIDPVLVDKAEIIMPASPGLPKRAAVEMPESFFVSAGRP